MNEITAIIPAYKPDEKLLGTLKDLTEAGFSDILVVDDGSGREFAPIFDRVSRFPQCTLLRHPANRGKGAALKTAMTYVLDNRPDCAGVVTADADGQHLAGDIAATAAKMQETGHVTLGVRDFSGPDVPPRSRMGNRITIGVFRLFFGMKISDTQTGLRAFPRSVLPELLKVEGDRYEFETHMLFHMSKLKIPFEEVPIHTVYLEENHSSHFRVVRDSVRIYGLMLKYLLSSAASALIDEGAFFGFQTLFGGMTAFLGIPTTFLSAIFARIISSLANFFLNARVVFDGEISKKTVVRYYVLAVGLILASASLVFAAERIFTITSPLLSTLIKIIVDTVLFFFSFRIQHTWVFRQKKGKEESGKGR